MPTIKFTATPELPFDIAHLGYKAGDVLEMNDASARRWVRRGVAEYWTDGKQAAYDAKVERKTKLAFAALPGLAVPTEVDDVVDEAPSPEPENEIGNSDEKPAEAVADVEENGEGKPAIDPAIDELPKRRGRKARES